MRRSRLTTALAATAALTVALVGCSSGGAPDDFSRTPEQVDAELKAADTSGLQLPLIVEPLELVEPGWDLPVRSAGQVFFSGHRGEDTLTFSAVDTTGTTRWQAERPRGCTGFTLTAKGKVPLVVLTDSSSSNDCNEDVTASAFRLIDGKKVWGPVDAPGGLRGPGTIFAAEDADPTEATALDPVTGTPVDGDSEGRRRLGEYQGLFLDISGDRLIASEDGSTKWELSLKDNDWDAEELKPFAGSATDESFIHLDRGDGTGPVFDRDTGDLLDEDARGVAVDANTQAVVTLGGSGLTVIDDLGKHELPVSVAQSVHLAAAAGGLLYLREGGKLRVHNAATGSLARGYRADGSGVVAIPHVLTSEGVGTLTAGNRTLLATTRVVEEPDEG